MACAGAACGDGNDSVDVGDGEGNDFAFGDNNSTGNVGSDTISSDGGDTTNVGNGA